MNCEEFRTAVTAEPNSANADLAAHAAQCPACAQYWQELRDMDRLIHRALSVSVPAQRPELKRTSRRSAWSLAASVLLSVSVALTIWLVSARDTLAKEAIAHVRHEASVLVTTSSTVEPKLLDQMLSGYGMHLKPGASRVSYVKSCPFRGHQVPHMVVQTEQGPVTVLVLPEERERATAQRIDEDGFQGVIMPAPRGVLVVLGQNVAVDAVAKTLLGAIDYDPQPEK